MTASRTQQGLDPVRWIDPSALMELVSEACASGQTPLRVRAEYLRGKPGRSALLGLVIAWSGGAETRASLYLGAGAASAADKARTLRLVAPAHGPTLVHLDSHEALLLAFPNDRALRGLSAAADARRLGNRLTRIDRGDGANAWRVSARRSRVTPVRWKPGRRAVLRAELSRVNDASGHRDESTNWLRVWPLGELDDRLAGWLAAAAIPVLGAPAIEALDAERGFAVFEHVQGTPWTGALALLEAPLRALHAPRPGLRRRDDADDLDAAHATLAALAGYLPEEAARAARLAGELGRDFATLAPIEPVLVHGDFGADQLLESADGVRMLDFDEAALGDPHADFASLAADIAARGVSRDADVAALARASLGARWSAPRWRAQLAAAHTRRALAALQRAGVDWAGEARASLARAEAALGAVSGAKAARHHAPAQALAPRMRAMMPGAAGRTLALAAVWPEREALIARLDDAAAPGAPALWIRFGAFGPETFAFPSDPALPWLASGVAAGFCVAGHRFGKRAALRAPDGRYLYLRPADRIGAAFAAIEEASRRLEVAGVPRVGGLELAPGHGGWWSDAAPGASRPATTLPPSRWESLGRQLARVHRTIRLTPLGASSLTGARRAAARQVDALRVHGSDEAAIHEQRLARWQPNELSPGTPAWIHGDLHPGQLVVGADVTLIDWERSREGEAEEDLGNLAAHLAFELGGHAALAWRSVTRGYASAGGRFASAPWLAHARLALVRVLAIWSWRDAGRDRTRDLSRWERVMEGFASW